MSKSGMIRILGIAGSPRPGSFNCATLRAAQKPVPEGVRIDRSDIAPIPLHNKDESQLGFPAPANDPRARIKAAARSLLVTPEYNDLIPCLLKNAIDPPSRPPEQSFDGKPIEHPGSAGKRPGDRSGPVSPLPVRHLSQWSGDKHLSQWSVDEPNGAGDYRSADQARCGREIDRSADTRLHCRASGGVQDLGAAAAVIGMPKSS
jgi:hypothetical protein